MEPEVVHNRVPFPSAIHYMRQSSEMLLANGEHNRQSALKNNRTFRMNERELSQKTLWRVNEKYLIIIQRIRSFSHGALYKSTFYITFYTKIIIIIMHISIPP